MTKIRQQQVKKDAPKAVDLHDDALDRAAGGSISGWKYETEVTELNSRPGTVVLK